MCLLLDRSQPKMQRQHGASAPLFLHQLLFSISHPRSATAADEYETKIEV
jgi:hypothetical protein